MSATQPPDETDKAHRDQDGLLHIPLSRRQALGATGAAIMAGLGLGSAAEQTQTGGDQTRVGDRPTVPAKTLNADGTLRELFVAPRSEFLPPVQNTPSVAWTMTEGLLIDAPSDSVSSTSTIRTNLAAMYLDLNAGNVSVTATPALVSTRNGGVELVLSGEPEQRSGLWGNVDRLDAANTESGLPGPGGLDNVAGWTKANGLHHQY